MARKSYAGAASATTLSTAITSSSTSFSVANATGYPASADPFVVVIGRGTSSEEKALISDLSGTTMAVASSGRGYDGTSAQSHSAGDTVEHCIDSITVDEANAHVNDIARDDHTQYLNNTRHDTTARHTFGGAFASPAAPPNVTTSASAGSAGGPARSDHTHAIAAGAINSAGMFAAGVVTIGGALATPSTPAAVATAAATGSATSAARSDHVHALSSGVIGAGLTLFGGVIVPHTDNVTIQVNGSNQLEAIAGSATVADGSITTAKIADANVTTAKIADANVTAAKLDLTLARGRLGYAAVTTSTTTIGTGGSLLTGYSVTFTPLANRLIKVTVKVGNVDISSSAFVKIWVRESATNLGQVFNQDVLATGRSSPNGSILVVAPAATAHTYTVFAAPGAGTLNCNNGATSGDPSTGFLLVEDIGPS